MKKGLWLFILCIAAINAFAAKTDTVYVYSKAMRKNIPNLLVVPDSYIQTKQQYPVMYLLHGAFSDFTSWWLEIDSNLSRYADQYQMILVCPDGGWTSWYYDSPVDSSMRYETYVVKELTGFVDSAYRTIPDIKHRAITGLSMGGHGGLYLAFRHQDVYGACGSTSGGVDIRPFPTKWDIAKRLGTFKDQPDNWEKNTVINMLSLAEGKPLKIIFDCGVDDFFYEANKKLHEQMVQRKIPHDYTERPGGHTAEYWKNSLKYQLLYFDNFFRSK